MVYGWEGVEMGKMTVMREEGKVWAVGLRLVDWEHTVNCWRSRMGRDEIQYITRRWKAQ